MNKIDHNQERLDDERRAALEQQDREKRGVVLCPNCSKETRFVHRCGNEPDCPDCDFEGCPGCMTRDDQYQEYFCSERCIIEKLGRQYDRLFKTKTTLEAAIKHVLADSTRDLNTVKYYLETILRELKLIP